MQSLSLTLLQSATHWHDAAANRALFTDLLSTVPTATHVVMLPEMFSSGFTMSSALVAEDMQGPTVTWMREQATLLNKVICGSLVICADGDYFNRFLWLAPGMEPVCYDKRHLFRMADEHLHYRAGDSRICMELHGWRICPMICYDLRFPVWLRNRGDYDLLLCVANWPLARQAAWHTLLRARAIENQGFAAGVNVTGTDGNNTVYGGGSAVYAPDGEVLLELDDQPGQATVQLSAAQLQAQRKSFPVWRDADQFRLLE